MPSNNILINHTISCEVHDDKMPELMEWLEQNEQKDVETEVIKPASHTTA